MHTWKKRTQRTQKSSYIINYNLVLQRVPILGQNQNVSWDNPNTIRGRERTTHQLVQMSESKNEDDPFMPSFYIEP